MATFSAEAGVCSPCVFPALTRAGRASLLRGDGQTVRAGIVLRRRIRRALRPQLRVDVAAQGWKNFPLLWSVLDTLIEQSQRQGAYDGVGSAVGMAPAWESSHGLLLSWLKRRHPVHMKTLQRALHRLRDLGYIVYRPGHGTPQHAEERVPSTFGLPWVYEAAGEAGAVFCAGQVNSRKIRQGRRHMLARFMMGAAATVAEVAAVAMRCADAAATRAAVDLRQRQRALVRAHEIARERREREALGLCRDCGTREDGPLWLHRLDCKAYRPKPADDDEGANMWRSLNLALEGSGQDDHKSAAISVGLRRNLTVPAAVASLQEERGCAPPRVAVKETRPP